MQKHAVCDPNRCDEEVAEQIIRHRGLPRGKKDRRHDEKFGSTGGLAARGVDKGQHGRRNHKMGQPAAHRRRASRVQASREVEAPEGSTHANLKEQKHVESLWGHTSPTLPRA